MKDLPVHVAENRAYWDSTADAWVEPGKEAWASDAPFWGIWHLPESELSLLPDDMRGMQAIELGCGTGYVSAWMARRGATCVGIDNSEQQLNTARALCAEHSVELTLLHGNAEAVPYPDESFDFAISEYGAAIWCDPMVWIPEAARLLKPGGRLVFLGNHPLAMVCTPENGEACEPTLHRDYLTMHHFDWRHVEEDPGGYEFNLPHSGWLALFRASGFEVEDYLELCAPQAETRDRFMIPAAWGKRWPGEQVWKLRKTS